MHLVGPRTGGCHAWLVPARIRRPQVWVVVPAHNEATRVGEVVTGLRQHFSQIVVIDDGSRDGTGAIARRAGARVVRHVINLGQGAALQTGFDFVRSHAAAMAVTFDADGQHDPQAAAAMVDQAHDSGVDVVLGSRFLGHAQWVPPVRRAVLRAAIAYTRLSTRMAVTDTHNGLRVLGRRFIDVADLRDPGMGHASEILDIIASHRLTWSEYPTEIHYDDYSRAKGQSSINALNIVFDRLFHAGVGR
ncbi:MAG: glycosyltransferase family 2 protein [Actinomycetales bacterium]|nr:glycosyltransferase family 2 protein [Actinomycetales bacterium]